MIAMEYDTIKMDNQATNISDLESLPIFRQKSQQPLESYMEAQLMLKTVRSSFNSQILMDSLLEVQR